MVVQQSVSFTSVKVVRHDIGIVMGVVYCSVIES